MATTGEALRDIIAAQGVEILERGHSVSKGNFNIKCPMCGSADQGHHMGIRLDNGWWGCWRNAEHRGKSPVRLLVAITGMPVWQVRRMLGLHSSPLLETFGAVKERLMSKAEVELEADREHDEVQIPSEFRWDWGSGTAASRRFSNYLEGRGFNGPTMQRVADAYSLMYAFKGEFADRIIIPYYYHHRIVTWTARSIHKDNRLRYRDLERERSSLFKDETVYNYDGAAMGGRLLVALEGQVDVLKGDWAGRRDGVRCVGLGTNSVTDAQLLALAELASGFDRVAISMDTPTLFAKMDSYRMVGKLKGVLDAEVLDASSLGKDLGGAGIRDIARLFRSLL